jgi:HD superfamily phosphohydrolase
MFRDPIHNYIKIEYPLILDLINSKEMQRLRRIRQLGTTSFTFHGAEHSRFTHSLGVYEIARRICEIFNQNYSQKMNPTNGWDSSETLLTLTAALLHDVGHGAYSHTFEKIFDTNHEQITCKIITSPQTEIFQILSKISATFPEQVAQVIQKNYPNPQVTQIISSQIDADRMDYLLRDAYYTGTKYGTFDLSRILRTIHPFKNGIAFKESGMHAVEDYIVSRYQMYWQVYFHPTIRAMEIGLKNLLKLAHDLYPHDSKYFKKTSPALIPFFEDTFQLKDYLDLDDGVLNTYFIEWEKGKHSTLSELAGRFLNRHPLKSVSYTKDSKTLMNELKKCIADAGFDPLYYTEMNSSYDLPYDFYRPETQEIRTQIEILFANGKMKELSSLSPLVAALAGNPQKDSRFYFPKEMLNGNQKFSEILAKFAT